MGILPEAHTSRSSNCDHLKIQILKKKKKKFKFLANLRTTDQTLWE